MVLNERWETSNILMSKKFDGSVVFEWIGPENGVVKVSDDMREIYSDLWLKTQKEFNLVPVLRDSVLRVTYYKRGG